MKGKVGVLELLVHARPFAAREKTKRGETILHLCVKYHQFEALKKVVEAVDDDEFLNQKDGEGLTILHLAVIGKQIVTINTQGQRVQLKVMNHIGAYLMLKLKIKSIYLVLIMHLPHIIKYLLTTKIDLNAKNAKGHTALNMVLQNPNNRQNEINNSLRQAGPLTDDEITNRQSNFDQGKWMEQKSKALMIVASLIANMAFQAGINPAGGVWQPSSSCSRQSQS
ncbi:unnamed protein product [Coffea canephora]|uniref:PGG domain-containing protein n=1 Tax=Coffea canephora TaxID=49390 RepID=A0A068UD83_COFCA|nr:unnamed protein product [Coffea canephora]